jgi:hypothetical protein
MTLPRTYNDLTQAIRREIPKTRELTFGLLYENDEKEFVVMNNDPLCFRIAISGVKCIPGAGTDINRLKVRIFEGSSPSVKAKASEVPDSRRRPLQSTSTSVSRSDSELHRPTTSTVRQDLVWLATLWVAIMMIVMTRKIASLWA